MQPYGSDTELDADDPVKFGCRHAYRFERADRLDRGHATAVGPIGALKDTGA
jgi:hypothetical protein